MGLCWLQSVLRLLPLFKPTRNCVCLQTDYEVGIFCLKMGRSKILIVGCRKRKNTITDVRSIVGLNISMPNVFSVENESGFTFNQAMSKLWWIHSHIYTSTIHKEPFNHQWLLFATKYGCLPPVWATSQFWSQDLEWVCSSGDTLCRNNRRLIGTPLIVIARQS